MEAVVKISKETLNNRGNKYKILKWMQNNPNQLRNTSCALIAKCIVMDNALDSNSPEAVRQTVARMVNEGIIKRDGTQQRGNFSINYWHWKIPKDIIDGAPQVVKDKILELENRAKEVNGVVTSDGCVSYQTVPTSTLAAKDSAEEEPAEETASEVETVNIPLEIKKDGKSISVSVTLNINL